MMASNIRTSPAPQQHPAAEPSTLQGLSAPTTDRVVLPLAMVDERKLMPKAYVVHHRSQLCRSCGQLREWSDIYAYHEIPPLHNLGSWVRNLTPCTEFRYDLPIQVVNIPRKLIPACFACALSVGLTHLPRPKDSAEWKAFLAAKAKRDEAKRDAEVREAAEKAARKERGKKRPLTIDDIL